MSEDVEQALTNTEDLAEISEAEYAVLRVWYTEWVSICKLLATFSFASIATTFLIFEKTPDDNLMPEQLVWIKNGIFLLGAGGLLAGLSIILAFVWMDAFSRRRIPLLVRELFLTKGITATKFLGLAGWVVSLMAMFAVLIGLASVARAIFIAF